MRNQSGEGKLGCFISILILGVVGALAYKAVPVYYGNSELIDACDFIASGASKKPIETIEREVKDKAKELAKSLKADSSTPKLEEFMQLLKERFDLEDT